MRFVARAHRVALAAVLSASVVIVAPLALEFGRPAPDGDVAGIVGSPAALDAPAASEAPPIGAPGTWPGPRVPDPRVPDPRGERSAAARLPADPSTLRGYVWPLPGSRQTQPVGP